MDEIIKKHNIQSPMIIELVANVTLKEFNSEWDKFKNELWENVST